MAKRKKPSKVQKRGKLPKGNAAKLRKAHKTVAKAKPKRAPVKKAARRMKQPVTPAVETVAVEVIEQPVTEVEHRAAGCSAPHRSNHMPDRNSISGAQLRAARALLAGGGRVARTRDQSRQKLLNQSGCQRHPMSAVDPF